MGSWKFIPDYAGYRLVLRNSKVQAILEKQAQNVKQAADDMLPEDNYRLDGHEVKDFTTKVGVTGKVIRTQTDTARYSQSSDKTLTKALKKGFKV